MLSGVAYLALAAAAIGVCLPWAQDGPVRLNGLDGPHNGWLVLVVAGIAPCWMRSMGRGSLVASAAVFGSALVIGVAAVNDGVHGRRVFDATAVYVVAASVVLASVAAIHLPLPRRARHPSDTP